MKKNKLNCILKMQKAIFIIIIFYPLIISCSKCNLDNNPLPRYSDMSAAEDAGQVKP